jgi:hypothetical protein
MGRMMMMLEKTAGAGLVVALPCVVADWPSKPLSYWRTIRPDRQPTQTHVNNVCPSLHHHHHPIN